MRMMTRVVEERGLLERFEHLQDLLVHDLAEVGVEAAVAELGLRVAGGDRAGAGVADDAELRLRLGLGRQVLVPGRRPVDGQVHELLGAVPPGLVEGRAVDRHCTDARIGQHVVGIDQGDDEAERLLGVVGLEEVEHARQFELLVGHLAVLGGLAVPVEEALIVVGGAAAHVGDRQVVAGVGHGPAIEAPALGELLHVRLGPVFLVDAVGRILHVVGGLGEVPLALVDDVVVRGLQDLGQVLEIAGHHPLAALLDVEGDLLGEALAARLRDVLLDGGDVVELEDLGDAVLRGIEAGEHRDAGGRAGAGVRVGAGEADPMLAQPAHRGQVLLLPPLGPVGVAALLVGDDDHEVRPAGHDVLLFQVTGFQTGNTAYSPPAEGSKAAHIRGERLISRENASYPGTMVHIPGKRAISRDQEAYPQIRPMSGDNASDLPIRPISRNNAPYPGPTVYLPGQRFISRDDRPYLRRCLVLGDEGAYLEAMARFGSRRQKKRGRAEARPRS
ncbi:MAG: hypothetical protein WAM82_31880 [Thermoanaerobaculia bacterium]